jgi:hypothetical protein
MLYKRKRLLICLMVLLAIHLVTLPAQYLVISDDDASTSKQPFRLFTVIVTFNTSELVEPSALRARIESESVVERLHRVFPRSGADRRFKRKTRLSTTPLVFNAGLIFVLPGHKYSAVVQKITNSTEQLLAFRTSLTEWGPSDVYIANLDHRQRLLSPSRPLFEARSMGGTWYGPPWREDPRMFSFKSELAISYTVTSAYERNKHGYHVWQRQAYALLNSDFTPRVSDIFINFGNNSDFVTTMYPYFEKNWLFFEHNATLHVLYSVQPFVVLKLLDLLTIETVTTTIWQHALNLEYGMLRGSTPPVRIDDTWWVFTHSSSYAVFVVCFSAATLLPVSVTATPMILAEDHAFVCGANFEVETQSWFLSVGVNDRAAQIIVLPHARIIEVLSPVAMS